MMPLPQKVPDLMKEQIYVKRDFAVIPLMPTPDDDKTVGLNCSISFVLLSDS